MDDDRLPAEPGPPAPEAPNPDPLIAPPSTSSHARRGRGGTVVALALAAILLFGTGSLFGRLSAPESGAGPTASPTSSAAPDASAGPAAYAGVPTWSLLDQAYELLRTNYVDPSGLDPTTLQQGAIRGLTDAVNDTGHTGYLTSEEVKARDQSLSGTFVGIGAVLDLRNNAATVVRVIPDSPAEKAGLRAGEVILRVDGASVASQTIEQIVVKVRGPDGTSVTLGLQDIDGSERSLTIVRAKLNLPLVSWSLAPGSKDAVIRLESFSTGAAKALVGAITAARAKGAAGIAPTRAFAAPVENDSSRMTASLLPGASDQLTSGRVSFARTIVKFRSDPSRSWRTSVTGVPSGPRTFTTICSTVWPATAFPSTRRITSSARRPAFSAGLSGMTRTTVAALLRRSSTAPMPTNVPESDALRAATSCEVR